MLTWIFKLLFKWYGWKIVGDFPDYGKKAVIIAAPHTSNWDFVFMIAAFSIAKIPLHFTIKKEWLKFPFKKAMLKFGAVGIDRSPKVEGQPRQSMTDAMADLFKNRDSLVLTVTAEGTRALRTEWKTGFYYVAKTAGVPIVCSYLDYGKKESGMDKLIWPSDNMEADLREIMAFYKTKTPKFPEKFSVDLRYV
jgi:1-acyl-sn-glycerol-3-phosphate acyltransferase